MTFLRVMFPRLFVALLLTSPVDLKGRHTGLVAAAYLRSSRVARAPSSHYVHVDSQAIRSSCPGYHRTRGTLFPAGRPGAALPSGGPLACRVTGSRPQARVRSPRPSEARPTPRT